MEFSDTRRAQIESVVLISRPGVCYAFLTSFFITLVDVQLCELGYEKSLKYNSDMSGRNPHIKSESYEIRITRRQLKCTSPLT